MRFFEERFNFNILKLFVCNGSDCGVEFFVARKFVRYFDAVFAAHSFWVGPWVKDSDVDIVVLECFVYVDYLGVAYIGAIFFECETENEDMTAKNLYAFLSMSLITRSATYAPMLSFILRPARIISGL